MARRGGPRTLAWRAAVLGVSCCLWLPAIPLARRPVSLAQEAAPPPVKWSDAEKEDFLRTARIVGVRDAGTGITGSRRATLDNGQLTHDAHVQSIDVLKFGMTQIPGQPSEANFRDSYKFNIAAYRLDRLIDMGMVPVSIERVVERSQAAITGNWRLHLIDFTRAFRLHGELRARENLGPRLARQVYEGLRTLERETLLKVMRGYLADNEIRPLLVRRDLIIAHYDRLVAARGSATVLYDEPGR